MHEGRVQVGTVILNFIQNYTTNMVLPHSGLIARIWTYLNSTDPVYYSRYGGLREEPPARGAGGAVAF